VNLGSVAPLNFFLPLFRERTLQNCKVLQARWLSCHIIISVTDKAWKGTQTRRPASADRTACCQFQATSQPVSRTQASDAMTSRLLRYEAKCVQHRCFQCGSVLLHSDIKRMELPPANILIQLERQLIALKLCR